MNVEPIQSLQGNLWDASWDAKVRLLRVSNSNMRYLSSDFVALVTNPSTTRRTTVNPTFRNKRND